MSHRSYLFSLRLCQALREFFNENSYSRLQFGRDLIAGITVGIIAIPLAMALAIASGVAPQYGLYTAAIGGILIALTGGSRFSVSGPTAAYVVILMPIAEQWGLGGLLLAGFMSGLILIGMAVLRLGRLIEYIPASVTLGFTAGIAVVIAILQLKDALGLTLMGAPPEYTLQKFLQILQSLPSLNPASLAIASFTMAIMFLWPRFKTAIPPHLMAVVCATLLALGMAAAGFEVDTIGTRFSYLLSDGSTGYGVPAGLPTLSWPWAQPDASGEPIGLSFTLVRALLPAAFAIAMLGAIESLLCAVVLDGMSAKRHSANSELLGQGIGNIVVPFFGGISATAAIARSALNYKAGAVSPIAAIIHGAIILLAILSLTELLAYLPMPAMAGLLIMVAWNMSEAHKSAHLISTSPASDILVWVTCFSLTVFFDMVIAISAGVVLASLLFMKEIASMTKVVEITPESKLIDETLPQGWKAFKIHGPLFFAAADRVFGDLSQLCNSEKGIILTLEGVSLLDAGGMASLLKFIEKCSKTNTQLYIAELQFQPMRTLTKARFSPDPLHCRFFQTLANAVQAAEIGETR